MTHDITGLPKFVQSSLEFDDIKGTDVSFSFIRADAKEKILLVITTAD